MHVAAFVYTANICHLSLSLTLSLHVITAHTHTRVVCVRVSCVMRVRTFVHQCDGGGLGALGPRRVRGMRARARARAQKSNGRARVQPAAGRPANGAVSSAARCTQKSGRPKMRSGGVYRIHNCALSSHTRSSKKDFYSGADVRDSF